MVTNAEVMPSTQNTEAVSVQDASCSLANLLRFHYTIEEN